MASPSEIFAANLDYIRGARTITAFGRDFATAVKTYPELFLPLRTISDNAVPKWRRGEGIRSASLRALAIFFCCEQQLSTITADDLHAPNIANLARDLVSLDPTEFARKHPIDTQGRPERGMG